METNPAPALTAETLLALVILVAIFGATLVYILSQVYFRARGVSRFGAAHADDYVTRRENVPAGRATSTRGNAEEEYRAEAEARQEARPGITTADINRLLEGAREQAAARALGTLIGTGIVPEGSRSRGMEALFGPAGRRHTRVRPWVDEAEGAARAARPEMTEQEEAPRVIGVNAGSPNERKILL